MSLVSLGRPKEASNWLMVEAMRLLKEREMDAEEMRFSPAHLAGLIQMVERGSISRTVAKTVFEEIFARDVDPEGYVKENGLGVVSDEDTLKGVIEEIYEANPQSVADYKGGKERAMGFLVGQTMRAMKGKADPAAVNRLWRERLSQ